MSAGAVGAQIGATVQEAITGSIVAGYNIWDNERRFNLQKNAHQNEVADLKKAGLNPILSAGGGGTTVGNAPVLDNPLKGSAQNLKDIVQTKLNADMIRADIQNRDANTSVQHATKNFINEQALTESSKRAMNSAMAQYNIENSKLPDAQKKEILSRIKLNSSQMALNSAMKLKWDNDSRVLDQEWRQLELQMDKERAYSDYYKSWWGKKEPYLNSILQSTSTAADIGTRGLGGKVSKYMLRKLGRRRSSNGIP